MIKEATTWLENFQSTQEAWSVCDQVAKPADACLSPQLGPHYAQSAVTLPAE